MGRRVFCSTVLFSQEMSLNAKESVVVSKLDYDLGVLDRRDREP